MNSYDRRYTLTVLQSILGVLLILVVPVLIWHHPLMDPALAAVPAAIGFRLLWPHPRRGGREDRGTGPRRLRPLT